MFATTALALLSCQAESEWYGTSKPKHGPRELWVNNVSEPEWIDPGKCSDAVGGTVITNTFEGLLAPSPETMQPEPGVAERFERSADGKVYTFFLRADAKWSDGTPVTSRDFAWSWARVLDPATGAKYADEMFVIENGDAFHTRALVIDAATAQLAGIEKELGAIAKVEKVRARDAATAFVFAADAAAREALLASPAAKRLGARVADETVLGLETPDDRTLRVTLQDPIPYFTQKITTLYTFYPVPRHVLERLAAAGKSTDLWTRPEHIVSNGPFVLAEWKFRREMVFTKNPHYWARDGVRLDKVVARMIDSNTTALQMYKAGETDFTGENASLPAEYIPMLSTKKDYFVSPWLATYFYWINVEAPGVSDPRVRRALNLATDKHALVTHVTKQGQIPATSVIKGGLGGYEQLDADGYDPEKARALLVEAGFPGGKGLPPIDILFNTNDIHRAIAEAIQEMWRRELGIDVRLRNQEWSTFLSDLNEKQFQIARLGWIGDYPDPYTFLSIFQSDSGNNRSNWKNPEFDRLLERSNAETDPVKRLAIMREAEALVMRDLPMIPLYFYTRSRLVKPYVHGIHSNFLDRHPWKAVWIE